MNPRHPVGVLIAFLSRVLLSTIGELKSLMARFISRKMPSRCIFFLRALSAWSMLLSRTKTCKGFHLLSGVLQTACMFLELRLKPAGEVDNLQISLTP